MNPFRPGPRAAAERTPIRAEAPSAKSNGTTATLRLYDPIDSWGEWWGVSAKEFTRVLDELPEEVTDIRLLINSPGGEVFEGIAIMNALRAHPAKVTAVVEGIAASSASFIAASADELVMMQNSQLYIHNAWVIALGDAAELREIADELEKSYDRNIASVYAAKSGDSVEHWIAEMDKDRYLTAEEAVAEKLADRIEGVGDAAAARARFDLSVFARGDRRRPAAARADKLPDSTEPGDPNGKETVVADDDLRATLAQRLGVTDAEVTDEQLVEALDEALAENAEPEADADDPAAGESDEVTVPEGSVLVDAQAFADLQKQAALGAKAHATQEAERREGIVARAIAAGRVAASARATWLGLLEENEAKATAALNAFPKNTVPVEEIGHTDGEKSADDRLAAKAGWGTTKKGA